MILFTAPYATRDADRLDITRGGCDRARSAGRPAPGIIFAPSKELLRQGLADRAAARGDPDAERIAWERYAALYRLEMLDSYRRHRAAWEAFLEQERVVFVCFCTGEDALAERCHRFLLAGFYARLGADYRGELEAPSTKAAYVRGEVAKGQTRPHHCHARDCNKQVPPAFFMCARHWKMVPRALQALVWAHYQPGQEKGDAGVTAEYCRVTDEAIDAVAAKEGKTPPVEKRLTIEDLTPHDRAEVEKFTRYLEIVAAGDKGPEARAIAYSTVYGGSP